VIGGCAQNLSIEETVDLFACGLDQRERRFNVWHFDGETDFADSDVVHTFPYSVCPPTYRVIA
jgi:hypothetical protein